MPKIMIFTITMTIGHIKSICPMLLTSLQAVVILKLSETDQQGRRKAILKYHKMHIAHFQIKCIQLISTTLQEGRGK